jgi:pyruvate,water dikinase
MMIRRYIDSPEESSPKAMHRRVEERREQRLAEVMPRLGEDHGKLDGFKHAMRVAQQRTVLIEDHNFYIDQQGPAASREVCMALGTKLASRGVIDKPEDVFYLKESEIRAAMAGGSKPHQAQVMERSAERERWMRVLPPASIGSAPPFFPPQLQQFFGPVSNEPMEAGAFKGVAGSQGVIRGTARLILTLDDIDRLAPGEILVTYATAPPWTPAFAIAGGIVTDIGGTLSHCAVVAREYGIPAVVGTRVATATIQDGQLITVDGTNGIVRLEG